MQEYNGVKYHSKREARYAEELDWLRKAGRIQRWERQVKIELKVLGVLICNYIVDFKVINRYGGIEFHEVKGVETPDFKLKWKLFEVLKEEICPGATLVLIK